MEPSSPPRLARALLYLGLALVAIVVAIGLWLASRPAPDQLQGMVDADEVNIATKSVSRVVALSADAGDRVRAGQILATLSNPEIVGGQQQAAAQLQSARALQSVAQKGARPEDVGSLRSTWLALQSAADLAAVSSRRATNLYSQGVIAAQRRDEAAAARDSSARQAEAARLQYEKALAGPRAEDKQVAAASVQAAEASVATATALGNETRLVSPIAGEVSRRIVRVGELASPLVAVYQVIDVDHPWVSLTLQESEFRGIARGHVLRGTIPALGRAATFRVTALMPEGDFATWRATRQASGYDVRSFEIRLRPVEVVAGLRPGMSVLFDWPQ